LLLPIVTTGVTLLGAKVEVPAVVGVIAGLTTGVELAVTLGVPAGVVLLLGLGELAGVGVAVRPEVPVVELVF
jgi:hypothetical protein